MSPARQVLHLDGVNVEVTRKSVRSMRLRVGAGGVVKVSAPHELPTSAVREFVVSKREWIAMQQAREAEQAEDLSHDGRLKLWGRWLRVVRLTGRTQAVDVTSDRVVIRAADDPAAARVVARWRVELVRRAVQESLPTWAGKMSAPLPAKLRVRAMTSRWGSCNHQTQTITVNSQLSQYPKGALEYVIVHELAHLRHPNHSPDFWQLVSEVMPNYTDWRQWLNTGI